MSCFVRAANGKMSSKGGCQSMDIVKIGKVLQELRKEKGLTQEQLAEQMGVTRRTVSRWETGSNMPDLDILMELSDFYAVDLREILCGERTREHMDKELRETVLEVADYSNDEKERLLQRLHWLFIVGLLGFVAFLAIQLLNLGSIAPYEVMGDFGLGLAFGMTIIGVIFTQKHAARIKKAKIRVLKKLQEKCHATPEQSKRENSISKITILGVVLGACVILTDQCLYRLPLWLAAVLFICAWILIIFGLIINRRNL